MYKKARRGIIEHFTGVDDPYEEPFTPDLIIKTDKLSIKDSFKLLLNALFKEELIVQL